VDSLRTYGSGNFLLDTTSPGLGGSGQVFDWNLAFGANAFGSIIIAGGLTPENVSAVINTLHPFGVDVASGVESRPGRKDYEKMRRFVEVVQRTDVELMGAS
jgi:phosphoribosylanthranilate isomerase